MKSLIKHWPREIAFPSRLRPIIENDKDFFIKVNNYNGVKNVYFSLYNCDKYSNFDNAIIDKVVYDFDDGEESLSIIKNIIPKLRKDKYKFSIVFSGNKGFHLYVYTLHTDDIINRYHVLYNAHMKIMDRYGLTIKDVDPKLIGDLKRIIRCPNTLHLKSRLYAIPLSADDVLSLSYKEIRKMAKRPRMNFFIHGSELFSLEGLDYMPRRDSFETMPDFSYDINLDVDDEQINKIVNSFHPCIKSWLKEPKKLCKNNSRWFFTVYCRDIGLPSIVIDKIAKLFWNSVRDSTGMRTKYQEYKQEKQLFYAAKKQDYLMPSCNFLHQSGFCKGKCKHYKRDGFPIYK